MVTLSIMASIWLYKSGDSVSSEKRHVANLGGLEKIRLSQLGHNAYTLDADSARETHISVAAGITTSLATYYQLYDIKFEADVKKFGHVKFESKSGQLDISMKRLRLASSVLIEFESGFRGTAEKIDINLITGHIVPSQLMANIHGYTVPAGIRKWEID